MPFDFKKDAIYTATAVPKIVEVPRANYVAIRGAGDPNEAEGTYQKTVGILYAISYTLRMCRKNGHEIDGYFEYVVPPLEGFWRQEGVTACDYSDKSAFKWISVIRLPDFVTKDDFDWAKDFASKKKKIDCSAAEFLTIDEGLCAQILHIGAFDDEPKTVAALEKWLSENGFAHDISNARQHHEIYLSDARKVPVERWRTIIRHPIRANVGIL